ALLLAHDVIVLQHPFYWYSVPPLLKQWFDLVLEHGWAYGSRGDKLAGKEVQLAITSGGREQAYGPEGHNRHSYREVLLPVEATVRLCKMRYNEPWVAAGRRAMTPERIAEWRTTARRSCAACGRADRAELPVVRYHLPRRGRGRGADRQAAGPRLGARLPD